MIKEQPWCNCVKIGPVARDGHSTCGQCGGKDAYKQSPERSTRDITMDGKVPIINRHCAHCHRSCKDHFCSDECLEKHIKEQKYIEEKPLPNKSKKKEKVEFSLITTAISINKKRYETNETYREAKNSVVARAFKNTIQDLMNIRYTDTHLWANICLLIDKDKYDEMMAKQ